MADWSDTEAEDRRAARILKLLYCCTYQERSQSRNTSNEAALFSETIAKYLNWFVLNDAKAEGYPLKLHSCNCGHLKASGTISNWPKIVGETRESLKQWAEKT